MQNPKLYFHPMSGNARRVLGFAGVHQIPLDLAFVDLQKGAQRTADYLALNPTGRVPTLSTEDAGTFWESHAILRYLATLHAPATLGTDAKQRARVDQWCAWTLGHAAPAFSKLNAETGLKAMRGEAPDPTAVQAAMAQAQSELALAATALSTTPYLAGEEPTTADFMLAGSLESCTWLSGLEPASPEVAEWLARMTALPGWPGDPRKAAGG